MDPNPMEFYYGGDLTGKRPRTKQVMDGDVLIGTIEKDYKGGGIWAVLASTGEQHWCHNSDEAYNWLHEQRSEQQLEDRLELDFSFRYEWHGYDGDL